MMYSNDGFNTEDGEMSTGENDGSTKTHDEPRTVQPSGLVGVVEIVSIAPSKIWIESGIFGERAVMIQHEGCEPFEYALFAYDYRYTSNSGTWEAARRVALSLGASEPIEHRNRDLKDPTPNELREQISLLNDALQEMTSANPEQNPD